MVGAKPVFIQTESKELIPSLQEIESAITDKTKAIIVNSPNNPSGAVYPEGLISDIVALCEDRHIFLICDDIYHKLVFDGNNAAPAYTFSKLGLEESNIIAVNGVAKLYGMTGFRIGWTISNSRIAAILTNIQAQTISCVSPVLQEAAAGALNGDQQVVEDLRQAMQQNRDIVVHGLQPFEDVNCMKPAGTFYVFPDFHKLIDGKHIKDSVALASFILQKAKVVTVPGKEFGVEGHLRLSYALDPESVAEGIERIRWALDQNAPESIQIGENTCVRNWR
jgi:aspartate aminotransferase